MSITDRVKSSGYIKKSHKPTGKRQSNKMSPKEKEIM